MTSERKESLLDLHTPKKEPRDDEIEISREDAIRDLLKDDELSDLTLRAKDGTLVIANRCLLASRSPVFRRMLFGPFKESSDSVIDVGYDGCVLRAIVDYIYLNTIPEFSTARFWVNLIDAAVYFALPELRRQMEEEANEMMQDDSDLTVEILATCTPGFETTRVLEDCALNFVKHHPYDRLLFHGETFVPMIHPSYIEGILTDRYVPLDEKHYFEILQKWSNVTTDKTDDDNARLNNQKRIAADMTKHIHLEDIDSTDLITKVAPSGLVSTDQLCEAFKTQSLRANKILRTVYNKPEDKTVWKFSQSSIYDKSLTNNVAKPVDTLACAIMKSGVHKCFVFF